jgi:hypothetical protein
MAKKWGLAKFIEIQWKLSIVNESDLDKFQTAGKITNSEKMLLKTSRKRGLNNGLYPNDV